MDLHLTCDVLLWSGEIFAAERLLCRSALKEALASPNLKGDVMPADMKEGIPNSQLSNIVLQYLRNQHEAACLSMEHPVSTIPPMSLTQRHLLPQANL